MKHMYILIAFLVLLNIIAALSFFGRKVYTFDHIDTNSGQSHATSQTYIVTLKKFDKNEICILNDCGDSARMISHIENTKINHIMMDGNLYKVEKIRSARPLTYISITPLKIVTGNLNANTTNTSLMILGFLI